MKFTVKVAEKMGRDAFKRGKKGIPVHDAVFMKALERYLKGMKQRVFGASEPFMAAWAKGWHAANVAAPVESKNPLGKMPMSIKKQKGSVRGGPAKRLKMKSVHKRGRPMDDAFKDTLPQLIDIREKLEADCIPCLGESDEIVSGETIKKKAVTSPAEWEKIFDKLKSKQVIYLSIGYPSDGYAKFLVGRRSKAKKPRWWSQNITLLPGDGSKIPTYAKYRLWKSSKDGKISASHGDMAVELKGIYVP